MLKVPYGYVAGVACDPIEKKPFFHVLPGSSALSFGMLGCDYHCGYCQNWVTSQMLRDPASAGQINPCEAKQIVELAREHRAPVIASTYNEPLITSEWAAAIFREAKLVGMRCVYVSNGNATREVLEFLRPHMDAYKVDLKTFSDRNYRQLGGVLEHVTSTIRMLKERGLWVEIVTLIVPGFSDDGDDLRRMADFIVSVDALMPWHVTAFHPDYKMTAGHRRTTEENLLRVYELGRSAGLKYIYPGNLPGRVGRLEDTRCHNCDATVIRRQGFHIQENLVKADGRCPHCGTLLPGIWGKSGSGGKRGGSE